MKRAELSEWWSHVRSAQEGIATAERAVLNARMTGGTYDETLEVRARDALGCLIGARELLALVVARLEYLAKETTATATPQGGTREP